MRWMRLLTVILSFVIDVKVRAGTEPQIQSYKKPQNITEVCVDGRCIYTVKKGVHQMVLGDANIYFSPLSSFVIRENKFLHMVRGVVRIEAREVVKIQSLYGQVAIENGSALIVATDQKISFTNISSSLKYQPLGEALAHELPIGYSTYISKMTSLGIAEAGFPHPAEIEPLIKNWAKVVRKTDYPQLHSNFLTFLNKWRKVTETVGPWYVSVVQREIASLRTQEAEAARLKAMREAEDQKYRDMFRRRIFGEN